MRIEQGQYEVLDSGSLYSPSLEDIKFIISESPLLVLICKIKRDNSEEISINLEVIDDNSIAIIFNNPSGLAYGISQPVTIATYKGKELSVTLHISMKDNNSSYMLEYCFYTKEMIDASK